MTQRREDFVELQRDHLLKNCEGVAAALELLLPRDLLLSDQLVFEVLLQLAYVQLCLLKLAVRFLLARAGPTGRLAGARRRQI